MREKQGWRKPVCWSYRWKQCLLHFSIRKAWSIKIFCPRRLQWMRSCIWTSFDISANKFAGFGLGCGQTTPGCSTKTTHPCTLPLKFTTFSQKIKWMCWTTHHIHLISLRTPFFYSVKFILKRHRFQCEDIQKNSTAIFKGIKKEEFRACFEQWKHRMEKRIQSGVTILREINFLTM